MYSSSREPDPVKDPNLSGTGVQHIESGTTLVSTDNVEVGNVVTFRTGNKWPYHTGLVTKVNANNEGKTTTVEVVHSNSTNNGPTREVLTIGGTTGLSSKIHGFYKWDTLAEKVTKVDLKVTTAPSVEKQNHVHTISAPIN